MKYICLIYFDPQQVFNGSPESNAVLAASGRTTRTSRPAGTTWHRRL